MENVVLTVMVVHLRITERKCADSISQKLLKWKLALVKNVACKQLQMLYEVKNLTTPKRR